MLKCESIIEFIIRDIKFIFCLVKTLTEILDSQTFKRHSSTSSFTFEEPYWVKIKRTIFELFKWPIASKFDFTEILRYQYFLIEEGNCWRILTFVWYTPESCDDLQLIEMNGFNKITNRWNSSNFEIKKFQTFY